jgi:GntR family transcriptional regulator, transcriptional repressor for pyruvate dehydrogenase complex
LLKPVEKQRVAEEIVGQLRSLILTGRYAPGDKLPPERQLAKELGVNRASLREALKKLEHMGLVKIRQGDGTRVQDFMASAGIDILSHLIPVSQSGAQLELVRDVMEFRRMYGREIARIAADRATDEDLARMVGIADACDDPALSAADLLRLDFDFYVALTQATHNRVLSLLINTTRPAVLSYSAFFAALMRDGGVVRRHQRELIAAIEKRDSAAAALVADAYMQTTADTLGLVSR